MATNCKLPFPSNITLKQSRDPHEKVNTALTCTALTWNPKLNSQFGSESDLSWSEKLPSCIHHTSLPVHAASPQQGLAQSAEEWLTSSHKLHQRWRSLVVRSAFLWDSWPPPHLSSLSCQRSWKHTHTYQLCDTWRKNYSVWTTVLGSTKTTPQI